MNHIIAALFVIGILFGVITATEERADFGAIETGLIQLESAMAALPGADDPVALEAHISTVSEPLVLLRQRLPRGLETGLKRMKEQTGALSICLASEAFDQATASLATMRIQGQELQRLSASMSEQLGGHGEAERISASLTAVEIALSEMPPAGDPSAVGESLDRLESEIASLSDVEGGLPESLRAGLAAMAPEIRLIRRALADEYAVGVDVDDAEIETRPTLIDVEASLTALRSGWSEVQAASEVSQFQLLLVSLAVQAREMTSELYARAGLSVDISIGLIGIMALWLGIMRVAEEAGIIQAMANAIRPFLRMLFPGIPKEHPANGALLMSMAANIMGLDNAATPLGLKAMKELQTLNTTDDVITDNQAMHLALCTSSLNLVPFSIIGYRIAYNSAMPNDIIVPVIIATSVSSIVAIIMSVTLRRFSTDPAAKGEAAEEITRRISKELHAALEGKSTEGEAKS